MKVLGIECTAHTFSVGIAEDEKILSNEIDTYFSGPEGFIPRKLADHHADVCGKVLTSSLKTAKCKINDIDLIAFSQGPGIGAPLSVGVGIAKYLAKKYRKKIVGVNHPYAHVKITEHLTGLKNSLVLYVSGGNSQILVNDKSEYFYKVIGETLDIGIGNMFDSFARAIKLQHSHGSALAKLAEGGEYVQLPYTVKGLNLAFSGLQSAAEKAAKSQNHKDVAHSLMETAFSMSVEVSERALFLTKKKNLIVCGGVAQNRRLQQMLKSMCDENNVKFGVAPDEYNRDNGAMIAHAGELLYQKFGETKIENCVPITNYRIDRMKELLGR